ncbi:MAG: tRNA lysidine(34) synthetase TilS [Victivallaceae bacterium]|nr:tRNA lysidine(34) synthetase TilS [Victivallaceae bacterium]
MIIRTVRKVLENFRFYEIYVGFSGGADSVSLLLAVNELADELELKLTAVHFEHGIRGEAGRLDAQWCREFCRQRKINYEQYDLHTLDERRGNESIEAVARRLRIAKWSELLRNREQCVVLLGHHADDRIENLFIRLCRGANVSGLTSLRAESVLKNIKFIRPLLSYSKADLIEFLADRGLTEWCVDHSNFDESYTRNYFRHRIIPDLIQRLPTAATGLIKAAQALETDALFIECSARAKYALIAGKTVVPLKFWRSLEPALLPRALRYWLSALLQTDFVPTYELIERFRETLAQRAGRQILVPLANGSFIWFHRGEVGLTAAAPAETGEYIWAWRNQPEVDYGGRRFRATLSDRLDYDAISPALTAFDADLLPEELVLSRRRVGDKMIPFGAGQPVKLKKLLTERKLTAAEKRALTVVRTGDGTIVWIPGVRHSGFATVTEQTAHIVCLEVID